MKFSNRSSPLTPPLLAGALLLALAQPAQAVKPLSAAQVMQQFNLVVLGDVVTASDVEGRSFIGGSLYGGTQIGGSQAGNATFVSRPLPASSYAGLTVLGSATGFNVGNGGLAVGGSVSGNNLNWDTSSNVNNGGAVVLGNSTAVNYNGSLPSYVAGTRVSGWANSSTVSTPAVNATLQGFADSMNSTNFASVMGSASTAISALGSNSSISIAGSKATFTAAPDASGMAVFTIDNDASFFATVHEFEFNLNGASSVFINSDLASGTLNANFLSGGAQAIGAKTIWNFSQASALNIDSQWGGSVLALGAIVITKNNIEGTLVADSLIQIGNSEMHQQQFTGALPAVAAVPEPSSYALMGLGLLAIGSIARRRATRPSV